ncbi:MAG TPA: AraC family transcriptional regulator [Clostridiales bacterium]|nr:AraC family transcriptional regulator [Clostridiales bacterium]
MKHSRPYRAEEYIRDGMDFAIVRCSERTYDTCVYHTHDYVEICYVAEGSGFHIIDSHCCRVQRGDLFIINYDVSHSFYREDPGSELITYNIIYKPEFIQKELMDFSDFSIDTLCRLLDNIHAPDPGHGSNRANITLTVQEQTEISGLFDNIYLEYTRKAAGYISSIRAYLLLLFVRIMRCFSQRKTEASSAGSDSRTRLVQGIIEYLNRHSREEFSLEKLAKYSFISKNYLCKLFKEATGSTLSDYICRLRVREACQLLSDTERKITDIALEVGFCDYKAFSTVFKKYEHQTPGEYRKTIRELGVSGPGADGRAPGDAVHPQFQG